MRLAVLSLLVFSAAASAAGPGDVASGIELRYNRLAGMQVDFEHTLEYNGRTRSAEKGTLYLLRPMRMRWEYTKPADKLLVGDQQYLRMYNPYTNQVRIMLLEESADFRAPLSFLLGRLNFSRQFKNLQLETIDGRPALTGEGRTGDEGYGRVEFFYTPGDYRLSEIRAFGRDGSITGFRFANEQRNPKLDDALFHFETPVGAEVLPAARSGDF